MTNDAAVAWQRRIRGDSGRWLSWCEYDLPDKDEKFPPKIGRWEAQYRPLYSATTVAELRAEVERLNRFLDEGGRRLVDENARANAAERRVAELREVVRYAVGNGEFNSAQFIEMCKQALARTSP